MASWPAPTAATLSLSKSDFGEKLWREGELTFQSAGGKEQKRWMDRFASVGKEGQSITAVVDAAVINEAALARGYTVILHCH